jgi:hypothetical protein
MSPHVILELRLDWSFVSVTRDLFTSTDYFLGSVGTDSRLAHVHAATFCFPWFKNIYLCAF